MIPVIDIIFKDNFYLHLPVNQYNTLVLASATIVCLVAKHSWWLLTVRYRRLSENSYFSQSQRYR